MSHAKMNTATAPDKLLKRAYGRTHYWRNREQIRERQRAYAARLVEEGNPIRLRRKKRYYSRHRRAILDRKRASDKAWRMKNPDYQRQYLARRRALILWAMVQKLRFSKSETFAPSRGILLSETQNSAKAIRF